MSGILKRPPVEPELALPVNSLDNLKFGKSIYNFCKKNIFWDFSENISQDSETNEEESAYNEHFKHSELRAGTGVSQ